MPPLNLNNLSAEQQSVLTGLLAQMADAGAPGQPPAPPDGPPAKKVKHRKPETIQYLTGDEWARLLKVITSPRDRAMFVVAYHRGLRASETAALQMSDVRLKDERIQINRCKGSASGEFHLCSSEIRALKPWFKVRGYDPGPVFLSREGKGISQQMQDVLMKRYGALAMIPVEKRHIHTLKHTCATHLLERGESLEDVQDHLGHRNPQNTQKYAKFTSPRRQARDKRLRDW